MRAPFPMVWRTPLSVTVAGKQALAIQSAARRLSEATDEVQAEDALRSIRFLLEKAEAAFNAAKGKDNEKQ